MAKSLEDTACYRFNRLISLNEVGSNPAIFGYGVQQFHRSLRQRQAHWPLSMNSTSTHDTKRGEDARARINVLSEIPSDWEAKLKRWKKLTARYKLQVNGRSTPDSNEEYYLYQVLLGSFPDEPSGLPEFKERLKTHLVIALREGKVNSSWVEPDERYESAVVSFAQRILGSKAFLQDFTLFHRRVAYLGRVNSLAQTLIKIASAGIPDFYQGSELWDLNMVDPDNRRQVDFKRRIHLLKRVMRYEASNRINELLSHLDTGEIKLYVIWAALKLRKAYPNLFIQGDYIPLRVEGRYSDNVFAFCRKKGENWMLVAVPRLISRLIRGISWPFGGLSWEDTKIILPKEAPNSWRSVFVNRSLEIGDSIPQAIPAHQLLVDFPVALLVSSKSHEDEV